MDADIVGWAASGILLLTLVRQVYAQWKSEQVEGISRWLFIGQITASLGFAVYSWLLHNWVFLVTNVALLATAIAGELIYLRNKRRQRASTGDDISQLFGRSAAAQPAAK